MITRLSAAMAVAVAVAVYASVACAALPGTVHTVSAWVMWACRYPAAAACVALFATIVAAATIHGTAEAVR